MARKSTTAATAATAAPTKRDDLAMPRGMSPIGIAAWQAVHNAVVSRGLTYTGGCRAFYSAAEWSARGERFGNGAIIVVTHDGGDVGRAFSYDCEDYETLESVADELAAAGFYAEGLTIWATGIYLTDEGRARILAEMDPDVGTIPTPADYR